MTAYIEWCETLAGIWYAYSKKKHEHLGHLRRERCGRFMQWLWYQQDGVYMSAGCLDEVREKQKHLFNIEHKNHIMKGGGANG